ncbi:sensor histidine kinase [Cohnella cellulosilytica]|uniref:histidine kinase n=1 Tax=Cohnella cellulosilytica TaxID=986710 RepID=A0ABW2FJG3_9BACL
MTNLPLRMRSSFFKDLNIKHKLLLSYLVLIVFPLGVLALLTYIRSSDVIEEKMMDISSLALKQTGSTLGYAIQSAIKSSNIVSSNNTVQSALEREPDRYDNNAQIDDFLKLSDYLTGIQVDQGVYRIRLYSAHETIYSNENVNLFNWKTIQDTELYDKALAKDGQIYWTAPYTFKYGGIGDEQEIVSGVRIVNKRNAFGETIGLVSVDILVRDIVRILNESPLAEKGYFYIADGNGELIARSDGFLSAAPLPADEGIWSRTELGGRSALATFVSVPYSGWKLVTVVPLSSLLSPSRNLRNFTFLSMLAIGVAAYLFALLISSSLVQRIRRLMRTMRKAEQGDLSAKVAVSGKDEIGEMEDKFNKMLIKIEDLVEDRFRIGIESKNAELRALQAQINPHFLYNTLELITCKALKYRAEDINVLVNLLAKFYKLSLSNGRDIVSIADEVSHIEAYVNIQNLRFEDRIKLRVDIDERLRDYSILKLVLQPIVENAILHGIMEKDEQTGTIGIVGRLYPSYIELSVSDDGVGMSADKVERILTEGPRKTGHGFGIANVDRRLKINCGESWGLSYSSVPGQGTTVDIRFPAVRFQA